MRGEFESQSLEAGETFERKFEEFENQTHQDDRVVFERWSSLFRVEFGPRRNRRPLFEAWKSGLLCQALRMEMDLFRTLKRISLSLSRSRERKSQKELNTDRLKIDHNRTKKTVKVITLPNAELGMISFFSKFGSAGRYLRVPLTRYGRKIRCGDYNMPQSLANTPPGKPFARLASSQIGRMHPTHR